MVSPADIGFLERGLSIVEARHLKSAKKEIAETLIGRKLLAETAFVPVSIGNVPSNRLVEYAFDPHAFPYDRNNHRVGIVPTLGVLGEGTQPRLLFNKNALISPASPELDLALIRALSIASLELPVATKDSFFFARVNRVLFASQYGSQHPKFARAFVSKVSEAKKLFSEGIGRGEMEGDLEKTAFDEVLFAQDPYLLYQAADAVPFVSQIEDFTRRYGPNFDGVTPQAGGKIVIVQGKVYPGILFDDSVKIIQWGGLRRVNQIHFYNNQDLELFSQKDALRPR